jgi:3',5'-cyclic AMP phosphodiesterase CpdA
MPSPPEQINPADRLDSYFQSSSGAALESIRIVHVSDLHFVNGKALNALKSCSSGVHGHDLNVLPALKSEVGTLKPDFIVSTGDQTTFGDQTSLTACRAFLEQLASESEVPLDRLYCIPGNHDVLLHYYCGFFSSKRNYEKIFGSVKVADYKEVAGNKVAFFSFDSTLERKSGMFWPLVGSRGKISPQSFNDFNSGRRQKHDLREYFKIALIHHHPLPIPFKTHPEDIELTTMVNGGSFIAHMQESGINLILHGHEHHPYSCQYCYEPNGDDIVVAAAGSAAQEGTVTNSFNYLEIVPGISVTIRRYNYDEAGFHIDKGATKTFHINTRANPI